MNLYRPYWQVIALSLATSLVLTGCDKPEEAVSPQESSDITEIELLNDDIITTKLVRYQPEVTVTGTLDVANKTSVQPRAPATVDAVLAKVGDTVNKGEVLIQLNDDDNQSRINQAKANLAAAKSQYQVAQTLADKNTTLYQQGYVSEIEKQQSDSEAQARREQVKAQQANLDIATKSRTDTQLTAPISGVIASRQVEVGQTVSPGQILLDIVDNSKMEFEAQVPDVAQPHVSVGQAVSFTVPNMDKTFTGYIDRIAPQVNASNRLLPVYVAIDSQENSELRAGMFATGTLSYGQIKVGALIPDSAVMGSSGAEYVLAIEPDQTISRRSVDIIDRDDQHQQVVVENLEAGNLVITSHLDASAVGKKAVIAQ